MNQWYFNPILFEIGPFQAHWYGLMYALTFIIGYLALHYSKAGKILKLNTKDKDTFIFLIILGILLGARIGYILFYNLSFYIENPTNILRVWEGGMASHGGLIGAAIAVFIFVKIKKASFLELADFIVKIAPIGIILIRIGNFINAELYGRIASQYCIYFPTDPSNCRYPSQLFQAFLEGFILLIILYFISKKTKTPGVLASYFLILYGLFRIIGEFFREPDPQIGFLYANITQGQILSSLMIAAGAGLLLSIHKKWYNKGNEKTKKNKKENSKKSGSNKSKN